MSSPRIDTTGGTPFDRIRHREDPLANLKRRIMQKFNEVALEVAPGTRTLISSHYISLPPNACPFQQFKIPLFVACTERYCLLLEAPVEGKILKVDVVDLQQKCSVQGVEKPLLRFFKSKEVVCYSSGGSSFLFATAQGEVYSFSPEEKKVVPQFFAPVSPLKCLAADGTTYAIAGEHHVFLYDKAGSEIKRIGLKGAVPLALAICKNKLAILTIQDEKHSKLIIQKWPEGKVVYEKILSPISLAHLEFHKKGKELLCHDASSLINEKGEVQFASEPLTEGETFLKIDENGKVNLEEQEVFSKPFFIQPNEPLVYIRSRSFLSAWRGNQILSLQGVKFIAWHMIKTPKRAAL